MNIRITRLSMTNFKCFRDKELNLNEDIVTVRGRNGAGKTTIADAILFCFFGKNSEGQSDLELFKTRENGKVIPNLDHSVELRLVLFRKDDGYENQVVTLRRSIKEVWVKKRGSEESVFKNNTVEYFVNAESYTKADYEKYIASLVDERVFRAITNPTYFPSLKWQDQRSFLTAMVGDVEVPADNVEFAALLKQLEGSNEDIEAYLKHLKYQIKQIKDKLDKIPVRLEEQNKALPERLDWDALKTELDNAQSELKEIDEKIAAIQNGNGADVQRKEIINQINETVLAIEKIRFQAQEAYNKENSEIQQQINQYSMKFNEELNNQKLMDETIKADNRLIERCEQTMKECDDELERLRIAWPTRKFELEEGYNICPTCGRYLEPDTLANKVAVLRTRFNEALEAEKQRLRDKASKIKEDKIDAEKELESTKQKLVTDTATLEVIKETINTIFSEKAKLEKHHIPTVDERLSGNEEYVSLSTKLGQLKASLVSVSDSEDNNTIIDLKAKRAIVYQNFCAIQQQLATRQQYDRILALIDGINEEQKDLVRQLSELEKKEDIARQYQFRQNQLLEERINQHFKLVQWKLFRTVNNGGDSFEEPFCECYVGGIPYHAGLNQAARLNAGLDIINALCKFYNVAAPICLDNSESCINIMQTAGQQVRLQVTDTDLQLV